MVSFATRRVGLYMHRLVGSPSWGRRKWRGASASLTAGCSVHEVLRKSSEIATGRVANPKVYALPADLEASMDALLASDERDAVVETLFRELESMSEEDLSALRSAPSWPGRVAAAPTITRELRAEGGARLDPEQAAKITVPVLLLTGENSSDPSKADIETVAAALPDARIKVLEGQEHVADIPVPKTFSEYVMAFLRES
jgi:pimeloyl-ACP methyl ester carboxylesterase